MVPLGSKSNWFTLLHVGHGTLTEATALAPPANPLPAHFNFTPTLVPQLQQAKSSSTSISIIEYGSALEKESCPRQ